MGWKTLTKDITRQLKPGTLLKCINPNHHLKENTIYIYSHHNSDEMIFDVPCIYIKGINTSFYCSRFAIKDKHGSKMRGDSI